MQLGWIAATPAPHALRGSNAPRKQSPSWRGGYTCDKVLSGAGGGWLPLVPPSPSPFAVSAQIRMAVVTTRSVSTLTDFYDLHLSLAIPMSIGPRAPRSGPAAWSATELSSHGTFGLNLMVESWIFPKSLGRSPLPNFSDRNWKGGGTGRYPRSSPTTSKSLIGLSIP